MAMVIRDLETGLFFAHGHWTHDPKLAQDFADEESAAQTASKNHIKNADLVIINEDGRVIGGTPIRLSNSNRTRISGRD